MAPLPEIALAQMEVRPGQPDLNVERMLAFIDEARGGGAESVVVSERCGSGYILGDLWEVDALVEDFAAYGEEIRRASKGLTVGFGNVAVERDHIGQGLHVGPDHPLATEVHGERRAHQQHQHQGRSQHRDGTVLVSGLRTALPSPFQRLEHGPHGASTWFTWTVEV